MNNFSMFAIEIPFECCKRTTFTLKCVYFIVNWQKITESEMVNRSLAISLCLNTQLNSSIDKDKFVGSNSICNIFEWMKCTRCFFSLAVVLASKLKWDRFNLLNKTYQHTHTVVCAYVNELEKSILIEFFFFFVVRKMSMNGECN